MKRLFSILFIGCLLYADVPAPTKRKAVKDAPVQKKRKVVDELQAIIYHPEGTTLICQSDLRTEMSGRVPSLKDAILRELIVLDGKKLKIPVTESEIERALARAQEQLKMDKEELIAFFKKQGFTLDEAKKELEKSILVENVIEARIRSKSHVSSKDLEMYHKNNPIELYSLQQTYIPYNGGSKALTKTLVKQDIASGAIKDRVWQDVGTINGEDFAPEKAHIKTLPEGTAVIADETGDGIVLLCVTSKKVTPFEERKEEIAKMLGQQKYVKTQADYFEKLMKQARIKYIKSNDVA